MKKTIFILAAALITATGFAQSEKYVKAMEAKVGMLDSNNTADGWKDLANAFERIAETEKTQWLPYYYASYATVMAGNMSMPQGGFGDNSALVDPYADKAEQLLNKAMELEKENSDIYCVKKMVHTLRMMGNAMSRFMTEGGKAAEALAKAKKLNENNPRVYILEGQDKFYTPEQFGGNKEEAKVLFEKANTIFMVSKPGSSIEPQWGRSQVMYFLSQIK
jgi:tetratricopeptide (TPR) repeat protein